jgi:threonine/homoserine/homoserine lactone efflux protein
MLEIFVASLLIGFSGAVAPGPLTAFILGTGKRRPFLSATALWAGHSVTELLVVGAIAFGFRSVPHLQIIAIIGAAVLIVFGVLQVRNASAIADKTPEDRMPFVFGVAATLSNPYWWIWWLTFGVGFLAVNPSFPEFYLGHISADLAWFALLSLLVAKGAHILGPRYKRVVQGSGIAMVIFGLYFMISLFS